MAWATEGVKVDPVTDDLLADTGQLSIGIASFTILMHNANGGSVVIQHRNAMNNADLHSQKAYLPSGFLHTVIGPVAVVATGERLRVLAATDFSGEVQVSILQ